MRYALTLLLMLACQVASAADAIVFNADPGQTLYARVYTSPSTAVAAAFTAGTSGNTRRYVIDTSAFTLANGVYYYTIFVGTPSTTAADTAVGYGEMVWGANIATIPVQRGDTVLIPPEQEGNLADTINAAIEAGDIGTGVATIEAALPVNLALLSIGGDGRANVDLELWRGTQPVTLDANNNVPSNLAAVNGNATRATTLASYIDAAAFPAAVPPVLAINGPSLLVVPRSGTGVARYQIFVLSSAGALVDPAANTINITVTEPNGGTPPTVNSTATRTGVGRYYVDVPIASTTNKNLRLNISAEATVGGVTTIDSVGVQLMPLPPTSIIAQ